MQKVAPRIFLIIAGIVLTALAIEGFVAGRGNATEPVLQDLSKIAADGEYTDSYAKFGQHVALYDERACSMRTKRFSSRIHPDTPVRFIFYPIIPPNHSRLKQWEKIASQFAPGKPILKKEFPPFNDCLVFVKTKRYKKFGEVEKLPMMAEVPQVSGMLIPAEELPGEELKLLTNLMPATDWSKAVVLQEGAKPSFWWELVMLSLGAIFFGFGAGSFLFFQKHEKSDPEHEVTSDATGD